MHVPADVTPEVVTALRDRVTVRAARHAIEHTVRAGELDGRGQILTGSGDDAVVTDG